jgi:hypothetical protein
MRNHTKFPAILVLDVIAFIGVMGIAGMLGACTSDEAGRTPFSGNWILELDGQNLLVLSIDEVDNEVAHDPDAEEIHLAGTLLRPRSLEVRSDGYFSHISADQVTLDVAATVYGDDEIDLSVTDGTMSNTLRMRVTENDRAEIRPAGLPVWMKPMEFRRARSGDVLAIEWTTPQPPTRELAAVRDELLAMAEEDQAVRNAVPVRASRLEETRRAHLPAIERIHATYGRPEVSEVGREAAAAFWLLVQHQELGLQQRLLPEMEEAVAHGDASAEDYALLFDRVMIREGREQRWGTQTSCVDGEAVLDPVEDPAEIDRRRQALYLPPLDAYLEEMGSQCRYVADQP